MTGISLFYAFIHYTLLCALSRVPAINDISHITPRRFIIHLYDLIFEGFWEDKEAYIYYTEFVMEMGILSLNMMHHIHMVVR